MAFASRRNDATTQALTDTVKGTYKPKGFSTLKYPLDLSTESFYPDAVCFTIMKRIGVSIKDVSTAAAATYDFINEALSKGFGGKKGKKESGIVFDEKSSYSTAVCLKTIDITWPKQ